MNTLLCKSRQFILLDTVKLNANVISEYSVKKNFIVSMGEMGENVSLYFSLPIIQIFTFLGGKFFKICTF